MKVVAPRLGVVRIADPVLPVEGFPKLVSVLQDDFSLGSTETVLWSDSTPTIEWINGKCRMPVMNGIGNESILRTPIKGEQKYILTNSSVYARVIMPVVGNGTKNFRFSVMNRASAVVGDDRAEFQIQGSTVTPILYTAGTPAPLASLAYDASLFAFMRFRHATSTLFWEYSYDFVNWTIAASVATPGWLANVCVNFEAFYTGVETASNVLIDSVNVLSPIPDIPLPPSIMTLVDDFDASLSLTNWPNQNGAVWNSGSAEIPCTKPASTMATKKTAGLPGVYRFGELDTFKARMTLPAVGTGTKNNIMRIASVADPVNNFIQISASGSTGANSLICLAKTNGVTLVNASITYNPINDAWWRFNRTPTIMSFEASFDSTTFGIFIGSFALTQATKDWLDLCFVEFESGYTGTESASSLFVDNVNSSTPLVETLTDDFASGVDKTVKWAGSSAAVVADGAGACKIPCTKPFSFLASNINLKQFTLVNSKLHAKVTAPTFGTGTRSSYIQIVSHTAPGNSFVTLSTDGSAIFAFSQSAGSTILNANIPYNPTNHKWLRIRVTGSTLFCEAGNNGITFGTTVGTVGLAAGTLAWMSLVNVVISSGFGGTETASDCIVDNVNI